MRRRERPARGPARPDARPRGPRGPRAGAPRRDRRRTGSRRRGARPSTRCASAGGSRCRCIPSTGRCRWSGTCRRCRRWRAWSPATTASSTPSACSRPSTRCGSRSSTWPAFMAAGDPEPVRRSLARLAAMRRFMRAANVDGRVDAAIAHDVGMEPAEIEAMFQMVAIGDYDDRYVIPKRHGEASPDAFAEQGSCGIDFSGVTATVSPGGRERQRARELRRGCGRLGLRPARPAGRAPQGARKMAEARPSAEAGVSLLLQYPSDALREAAAAARELEIAPAARSPGCERCTSSAAGMRRGRLPSSSGSTSTHSTSPSNAASTSPTTCTATAASAGWRCSR